MMANKELVNQDKDKGASTAKTGGQPPKGNEVKTISDDKFGYKPKFDEANAQADPWKGRGGAFEIDEKTGLRVPVEVPHDPMMPLPPDAYPDPDEPAPGVPEEREPPKSTS